MVRVPQLTQLHQRHNSSSNKTPSRSRQTAVGRLPWETYVNGSGLELANYKELASPFSNEDKSAEVSFTTPPLGHEEYDPKQASKMGYRNLYWKSGSPSVFTVMFNEKKKDEDMEAYINNRKKRFYESEPSGKISHVSLSTSAVKHITGKNVSVGSLLFTPNSPDRMPVAHMALFMQTPSGFWDLTWHSTLHNVCSNPAQFVSAVQRLDVNLNKALPEATKPNTASDETESNDRANKKS